MSKEDSKKKFQRRSESRIPRFVYVAFYILTLGCALAGLGALGWEAYVGDVLRSNLEWAAVLGMLLIGVLGFQTVRIASIWRHLSPAIHAQERRRNPEQISTVRRGFGEIFVYLIVSQMVLVAVVFVAVSQGRMGRIPFSIVADKNTIDHVQVYLLLGFLLAAYMPPLISTFLIAKAETQRRKLHLFRSDVVSPLTFAIASLGVLAICILAWAAGGRLFEITNNFGVYVTLVVMAAFVMVIIAPLVANYLRDRREASALVTAEAIVAGVPAFSPAAWYSWFDSSLVRLIAPLSGATQQRVPHLLVILTMVPLSAMGYALPSPYGLLPLAFAVLLALSLGRRWAWVEADRETASRLESQNSREIHIGFDNDLKDEALLGYAMLFILIPLSLYQLQGITGAFVYNPDLASGNALIDWSRFFGAELAKAVPFVDWWEVYDITIERPYEPSDASSLGMHLTFASRAIVDLVLLAALLQAIGIWQRNRAQRRLYSMGHLNAFDPFTEREFFEDGMRHDGNGGYKPRALFVRKVQEHFEQSRVHHPQALPYSQQRLSELIHSPNPVLRAGAKWMVDRFKVLAGEVQAQLGQIQGQISIARVEQLAGSQNQTDRKLLRDIKANLERVIQELQEQYGRVGDQEIGRLAQILLDIRSVPELGYAYILILELLGKRGNELAALVLVAHVIQDDHKVRLERIAHRLREKFPIGLNLFASHAELRMRAYDAMGSQKSVQQVSKVTVDTVNEVCRLMADPEHGDKSAKGRDRALNVANTEVGV